MTIGSSLDHYRCIQYLFSPTRSVRDVDTVKCFPSDILITNVNLDDFFRQTSTGTITFLASPPSFIIPSLEAGDSTRNALQNIEESLDRVENFQLHLQ